MVLTVTGEIDMETVEHLRAVLWQALAAPGGAEIVVDFAGVTFCDATGVQALADAHAQARANGVRLRLINLRRPVRRVLQITGMLEPLTEGDH
ncbi:STAS domain-containing protein [Actinoplanes sp. NPDC024001]|uniref:STAS domain-containing protein n=1 Tax=Actinoplanes sp. NPDC024001 TaxID=3154598 RepID=UPI0033CB60FB